MESVELPSTLKTICLGTFRNCARLKKVYVETGCEIDVKRLVDCSVRVEQK